MFWRKSNRIACRSNRKYLSILNTIRAGEDFETKISKTMTVEGDNFTEISDHKWSCQLFLTSWCIPPWRLTNFTIAIIFLSTAARFSIETNRKLNRIESRGFCDFWIENRIENDSIWQPCYADVEGTFHSSVFKYFLLFDNFSKRLHQKILAMTAEDRRSEVTSTHLGHVNTSCHGLTLLFRNSCAFLSPYLRIYSS
jgi:hypothetical protein